MDIEFPGNLADRHALLGNEGDCVRLESLLK